MNRLWVGLAASVFAAGCGSEDAGGHPRETEEYKTFLAKQFKIRILSGGPLRGSILLYPPAPQTPGPHEFFEVYVNGKKLDRFQLDANTDPVRFDKIAMNSGPNRVSVWDSSLNRGFSETLDSRQGTLVEITAGGLGWEIRALPE